jgi:DNA polymerase mu
LEKSIKEGKRQPYNQYQALHVRQGKATDDVASGDVATSAQSDLSPYAKLACQRESPLVCPNQELLGQLDVIRRARALDTDWRGALTYARAIAVGFLKSLLYALR